MSQGTSNPVVPVSDDGGSLTVDNLVLSVVGGGVEATAQRVTIASDSTGVLSVDDNGGSLTVDGTVSVTGVSTAANQATEITSLQLLDDAVIVLGTATYTEAASSGYAVGAVRRDADTTLVNTTNEWGPLQMDANGRLKVEAFSGETLPVSLASTTISGSVAVTNAGTFVVQENGAALTSLQLIDDTVYASDTALNKTLGIGAVFDDVATVAITENQAGYLRMSSRRALLVEGVASGTAISTNWSGTAPPIGGGVEATALRVTVANNSTGLLPVTLAADDVHDGAAGTTVVQLGAYASDTKPAVVQVTDAVRLNATLDGALVTKDQYNPTATLANVAASAASVQLLAASTDREGAMIFNDSTVALYVKLGITASTTSFSVKMSAGDYYEVPAMYSGRIDGIWDSATGNARVTEIT